MRLAKIGLTSWPLLLCAPFGAADEVRTMEAVQALDLDRYAGRWYEVARLPNRYQARCTSNVTATYELRDDGRVNVINRCETADGPIEARGIARREDPASRSGRLRVRFAPDFLSWLPFVWGRYWVLAMDDDYQHALVGEPGLEYLWILSRTPTLADAVYEELVGRAAELGYDIGRIRRTPQPE